MGKIEKSKSSFSKQEQKSFKSKVNKKKRLKNKQASNDGVIKGANVWKTDEIVSKEKQVTEKKSLFTVNEKGEKVKLFKKKGVERPWLDLKFEENDEIACYDGFFIRRSEVEQLDRLRYDLVLQGHSKNEIRKKMMKAVRKAKRELFKEKLYDEKFQQMKDGTYKGNVKVWNKKNLSADASTLKKRNQDNISVKNRKASKSSEPKCVGDIEDLSVNYTIDSDTAENDDDPENYDTIVEDTSKIVETNSYDADEQSVTEAVDDSVIDNDELNSCSEQRHKKEIKCDKDVAHDKIKTELFFEENHLMTCVDGFWIRRSCLLEVDKIRDEKSKQIIAARKNGNTSEALNEKEFKQFKNEVNVELLKMANKLRAHLTKINSKRKVKRLQNPAVKQDKQATNSLKNGNEKRKARKIHGIQTNEWSRNRNSFGGRKGQSGQNMQARSDWQFNRNQRPNEGGQEGGSKSGLVRFDGYFVTKEAADRLRQLKEKLKAENMSAESIAEVMKKERRREENTLKHQRATVCFSCRQHGHVIADCPLKQNIEGVGSCFKCGSTEHQSSSCNDRTSSSSASAYSYATCFICRQRGHISKECPRNDKGLYPKGGGCTLCDSKFHLIKDCPRNQDDSKKQPEEVRAGEMFPGENIEIEDNSMEVSITSTNSKKNKHIKF